MYRWVSLQNLLIIFAATLIYTVRLLERQNEMGLPFKRLVIGIISARNHFMYRNAIRKTLGLLVQDMPDVELIFVLGDKECPIHPADRLSPYTCHRWNITEDSESSHIQTFFKSNNVLVNNVSTNYECNIGLGIRILHPIILEEVSVRTNLLKNTKEIVVVLEDPEEVIDSVKLTHKTCSEENGYCSIKLSPPLILPKGFEGELRVHREGMDDINLCGEDLFLLQPKTKWVCEWLNISVIEFKFVRTRKGFLTKWRENSCTLVSAKFHVADKNILMVHKKGQQMRAKKWKNHLYSLQKKIEEEKERNNDMLMLPLMDIYSNLPHKVRGFLNWVTSKYNASYIMKIDDDTILNIHHLETFVNDESNTAPSLWSQFHYHRSVPVYGKWADTDYPSPTYPTFPSGAGYLMTGSLARTLTAAVSYLTTYGGEDVSMGIWVSLVAGNAKMVDVPCWLPHPRCSHAVLIPQLSVSKMTTVWDRIHAD
ncbi:UDP-GalNAc:beta-1,3-N-acetylgalactosaminyltransferase 2 isoform X4 [Procambarus clarkii]|uniref:UDP-GalNAc:beta-1, 3-N-acetylgalactosaminyltransferase 2 isoform X4 n=1 Tax=Procambarus clarkii TaxID=6728 RepID=UPI001E66FF28|nr:UDP-GalNAc:beta-1,3-N-acetylgalactosaminyltransferase 2-like isoform X1 [Procambarus clarkii]